MCVVLIHRFASLEPKLYLYTLSRVPHKECASVPEPISLYDPFTLPSLRFTLVINQEFHLSISLSIYLGYLDNAYLSISHRPRLFNLIPNRLNVLVSSNGLHNLDTIN